MPRRLAMAKHAAGFDAVGWTLLGFLLGASLAVFALLHADFRGMMRPLLAAPPPEPPRSAVVSYTPPSAPVLAGPSFLPPTPPTPPASAPAFQAGPPVNALASAGAASARSASRDAAPKTTPAPAETASAPSTSSPPAADAQVEDDAAAAGMTSKPAAGPDLY